MENSKKEVQGTIEERVKALISDKLGVDLDQVVDDAELRDHLGADSLDVVEIIMELEKEFDIIIDDDKAEGLENVSDHVKIVQDLVANNTEVNLENENVDGRV